MQKSTESVTEHLPLEEIRVTSISCLDPPVEWEGEAEDGEPPLPPVLVEEDDRYSLLVHHRTVWSARASSKLAVRSLVVRSAVHIPIAHKTVRNCLEEALLFDGLLRTGIVPNRSRLAEMLGFSRARITQVLNILKLPLAIRQRLLLADHVSEFQLRPLVKLDDEKRQLSAFSRLMVDKLTGRQMALFAASEEAGGEPAGELSDIERIMAAPVEGHSAAPAEPASSAAPEDVMPAREAREPKEPEARIEAPHAPQPRPQPPQPQVDVAASVVAQRQSYSRVKQLLESLGTLREADWQEAAARLKATREEMILMEGLSLLRKGLYERAVETLLRCVNLVPDNASAYYYIGRCYNLLEEPGRAEEHLRKACEIIPDDPEFLSELAIVLEKQNRQSEAASFYRKAGALRKSANAKPRRT